MPLSEEQKRQAREAGAKNAEAIRNREYANPEVQARDEASRVRVVTSDGVKKPSEILSQFGSLNYLFGADQAQHQADLLAHRERMTPALQRFQTAAAGANKLYQDHLKLKPMAISGWTGEYQNAGYADQIHTDHPNLHPTEFRENQNDQTRAWAEKERALRQQAIDYTELSNALTYEELMRNIDFYADLAEQRYQEYIHSEDYVTRTRAHARERDERMRMATALGADPAYMGLFNWDSKDEREEELRAIAAYYRNLADAQRDEQLMTADMEELSQWTETERRRLGQFAVAQSQNYTAEPGQWNIRRAEDDVADLFEKYGEQRVRELAESYLRYQNQQYAQSLVQDTQNLGLPEQDLEAEFKYNPEPTPEDVAMNNDLQELARWSPSEQSLLVQYAADPEGAEDKYQILAAKYGKDVVNRIAESYTRSLQMQQPEQAPIEEPEKRNGWSMAGHSAASVGANLIGSMTGPTGYLTELMTRTGRYSTMDPYNAGMLPGTYAGTVRQTVSEELMGRNHGMAKAVLYQAGMSALDNLARMIVGGKVGSLALAATGSFGSAVQEYSQQGTDPVRAVAMGVLRGAVEVITEKVSLDNLLKEAATPKGLEEMLRSIFLGGGIEVTEEEFGLVLTTFLEAGILREESSFNRRVAELQTYGLNREQAREQACYGLLEEALNTGIQSFLSGGMMTGAVDVYANVTGGTQPKTASRGTPVVYLDNVEVEQDLLDSAERISKATGRNIVFYSSENTAEGGFYDPDTGAIYINVKGVDPMAQIFGHELTHSIESSAMYQQLSNLVMNRIRQTGGNLEQLRAAKMDLYKQNGQTLPDQTAVDREIVASYVASHLLTNEQEITSLVQEQPSVGRRILNWLNDLLAKWGNKNAQERQFIRRARDYYARALDQSQRKGNVSNSGTTLAGGQSGTQVQGSGTTAVQGQEAVQTAPANAGTQNISTQPTQVQREAPGGTLEGMSLDDQKKALADDFRAGRITEEEFDAMMEAIQMYEEQMGIDSMAQDDRRFQPKESGRQYSFAGPNARTANLTELRRAEEMERRGIDSEQVRKITGWFRGMDGKWRYEIDDSSMQYFRAGDAMFSEMHPEYARHQELMQKFLYGELTEQEEAEFRDLDEIWGREHQRLSDRVRRGNATLQNVLRHDELFAAYPELRGVKVKFGDLPDGTKATYSHKSQTITLSNSLRNAPDSDLLHEIQHAIQNIEGFATGSTTERWQQRIDDGYDAHGRSAKDLYRNTAGEIEARDVASRRDMSAEGRKNSPPRMGDERTVFAEETGIEFEKALHEYPYDMQTVIREYLDSVDERVLGFVEDVQQDNVWPGKKVVVCDANNRLIDDILKVTGVQNSEKSKVILNTSTVEHIIRRHGKNGEHDTSMEDNRDIARMGYILMNYDTIVPGKSRNRSFKNRDNSPSKTIVLSKKINGTYFLVEAVPDTGKISIVSAYISKNGAQQVPDDQSPDLNARNELASAPIDSIHSSEIDVNRKYNIAENENADTVQNAETKANGQEKAKPKELTRNELNTKAANKLRHEETSLLNKVGQALYVPYHAKRDTLKPMIQEMTDEYLRTGQISEETKTRVFEAAYEAGIGIDQEFVEQYKDITPPLRTTAITVSQEERADIPNYAKIRNDANTNRLLRITEDGGRSLGDFYQEMQRKAPDLFPAELTHPADQLQKLFEVSRDIAISENFLIDSRGPQEAAFKAGARRLFDNQLADSMAELNNVRRYGEEKLFSRDDTKPISVEQAEDIGHKLKKARRNYEKVNAKHLLTAHDEMQVGRLLRGETQLEYLQNEENFESIKAVFGAKQEYEHYAQLLAQYKRQVRKAKLDLADKYLATANTWKDKKAGILYSRETMRRNIFDIIPDDPKLAEAIVEEYFEPIHKSEAANTRFKQEYRDRVKDLDLSRKVNKGDLVSEAHAVQLLGEAADNIRVIENSRGRVKTRDGKTLLEWQAVVQNLWAENPSLDKARIENSVLEFRKIYDELFQKMNQARLANGYEPVSYRQGYFPHFQPGDGDGIMHYFGKILGIDVSVDNLPTTINGLTHTFKPGIQWFGNAQERLGFNTAFDAVEGFDKYIEGVSSVIHHTENIQKLRALASRARYRTSDDGIREQVDNILGDASLSEDQKQALIEKVYEHGRFALANFVVELDEYTNLLANKKSRMDREWERALGRGLYTIMGRAESHTGANMIAGNFASALTNFVPLTQAMGHLGFRDMAQGVRGAMLALVHKDRSIVGQSDFLTNRRGGDVLVKGWQDHLSDFLGKPMELIDDMVSEIIVRAAYSQNLRRGLSESEAMHQADVTAASIMADRSKGALPTIFEAKNPVAKLFTTFQVEVNNQYSELFKDLPREYRGRAKAVFIWALIKYFGFAWLWNELEEKIKGRRSALDPLDVGLNLYRDFRNPDIDAAEAVGNFTTSILEDLPFSSALSLIGVETDGGRFPIASAIPDLSAMGKALLGRDIPMNVRVRTLGQELQKPITYLLMPAGGGQVAKAWKGIQAYRAGGSYSINKDGKDILQYPIYKDTPQESAVNLVKSILFGKSSLSTAQEWVANDFDSLNAEETAIYQDLMECGSNPREAYEALRRVQAVPKEDPELVENAADVRRQNQTNIILNDDLSPEAQSILFYGLVATENEQKLMDQMVEAGSGYEGLVKFVSSFYDIKLWEEDDKKGAYRDLLASSGLTEEEKIVAVGDILGTEETTETGNLSIYGKFKLAVEDGMSVDNFMKIYAAGASMDTYFDFSDTGIQQDDAVNLVLEMSELKPLPGAKSVSWYQECDVILGSRLTAAEQVRALQVVCNESTGAKIRIGYDNGLPPGALIWLKQLLPEFDANNNGSYTQREVTAAIDAVSGDDNLIYTMTGTSPHGFRLTNEQKAVLWQLQTGAKDGKSNPYDREIGKLIYDLVQADKEARG